jgi:spore coat polysaccharide biosynthesis protein SpsF (cytidylyltransferase family)/aryl-alcohol dehydrogenase-like predicted oxidoreductase
MRLFSKEGCLVKSIAILQARTNSSRLPGKVLLPIRGIPLVVLAATRAANTGREVIVATSNEVSDDALAALLADAGIRCFRGSLENTLQRVVGALEGVSDDTLVFRLTADNVFPDGALLDEMEEEFLQRDLKYLCCNGERSGLPYGLSAELTRAQYLREASANTTSPFDQEHVTPYIRRTYGETYFERYRHLNKGHFRCTVDCLDDYHIVTHVFTGVAAPCAVSALELVKHLQNAPYQPQQACAAKKLVLGSAQLGMAYGIANESGKPDQATVTTLIKTAIAHGVTFIDTARAYGDSEKVIGNALKNGWEGRAKIITKLAPLTDCPSDATPSTVNAFVDASVFQSCAALRTQTLDVLMLHRASQLTDWSGTVWSRLLKHRAEGRLKALGASVQSPLELELALATPEVEFIQMPFNVLDWRWATQIPAIREAKRQRPLVIHVRSALLQGLLTSTTPTHWHKANVSNPEPVIEWLRDQCHQAGRSSVADFCLSFVQTLDWVDGVVVGMETLKQFEENIQVFCGTGLSDQQMHAILSSRPLLDEDTLNPARWRN